MWVVVPALELEPGLENLGWYVDERSGEVTEESCSRKTRCQLEEPKACVR